MIVYMVVGWYDGNITTISYCYSNRESARKEMERLQSMDKKYKIQGWHYDVIGKELLS